MVLNLGQHRIRIIDVLETDNCKSADYPLKLWFKIPEETATIEQIQLTYLLSKFRAYTSATAAGSAHTHDITGQVTEAAILPGAWADCTDTNTNTVSFTAPSVTGGFATLFYIYIRTSETAERTIHWELDVDGLLKMTDNIRLRANISPFEVQSLRFWMESYFGGQTVTLSLFDEDGNDFVADVLGAGAYSYGTHTHDITGQATESESAHTHGMVYDIYEQSYTNPEISIKIDGTDYTAELGGPFTAEGKILDITPYITTAGMHCVELIPNQLIRITGQIFGRVIVGFAGEVAPLAVGRYDYSFYNYCVYG